MGRISKSSAVSVVRTCEHCGYPVCPECDNCHWCDDDMEHLEPVGRTYDADELGIDQEED